MLGRHLRRRPNINPALCPCIVFAVIDPASELIWKVQLLIKADKGIGVELTVWIMSATTRLHDSTVQGGDLDSMVWSFWHSGKLPMKAPAICSVGHYQTYRLITQTGVLKMAAHHKLLFAQQPSTGNAVVFMVSHFISVTFYIAIVERMKRGLWNSGWNCLLGKSEIAGSSPALAFKGQTNKM